MEEEQERVPTDADKFRASSDDAESNESGNENLIKQAEGYRKWVREQVGDINLQDLIQKGVTDMPTASFDQVRAEITIAADEIEQMGQKKRAEKLRQALNTEDR